MQPRKSVKVIRSTLLILKKSPDILEAKKQAEDVYDEYFLAIHPYIISVQIVIIREMFLPENDAVGYLIRVSLEAKREDVERMPVPLNDMFDAGEIRIM